MQKYNEICNKARYPTAFIMLKYQWWSTVYLHGDHSYEKNYENGQRTRLLRIHEFWSVYTILYTFVNICVWWIMYTIWNRDGRMHVFLTIEWNTRASLHITYRACFVCVLSLKYMACKDGQNKSKFSMMPIGHSVRFHSTYFPHSDA